LDIALICARRHTGNSISSKSRLRHKQQNKRIECKLRNDELIPSGFEKEGKSRSMRRTRAQRIRISFCAGTEFQKAKLLTRFGEKIEGYFQP